MQYAFGQNFSDSLKHSPSAIIPQMYASGEKEKKENSCTEEQYSADGRLLIRIVRTIGEKGKLAKEEIMNVESGFESGIFEYKYDQNGNVIHQIENDGAITWNNKYNDRQQLIYTERQHRTGGIDIKREFEYDAKGNKTETRTLIGSTITSNERNVYNKKDQLITTSIERLDGENKMDTYYYEYDANGNLISEVIDFYTDKVIDKKTENYYKANNVIFRRGLYFGKYTLERWEYDPWGNCIFYELDNNNDRVIDEYATFCYDCYQGKECKVNPFPEVSDISKSNLNNIKAALKCGFVTDAETIDACDKLAQFDNAETIQLSSVANKRIIGYGYKFVNLDNGYKLNPELLAFEYNSETNKICLVPLNPDNEQEQKDVLSAVKMLRQGKKPNSPNIAYDFGRNYIIKEREWKRVLISNGKSKGIIMENRFLGRETKNHILFLEIDHQNSSVKYTDFYIWIFMKPD